MRLVATAVVGAGLVICVVLWMMLHHKPGWYRPAIANDATLHRAQVSAAELLDSFSDRLAGGEPFYITLQDSAVNDWLAALPRLWPESERAIPPEVRGLAVRFDMEEIRVGAHLGSGELQAIINTGIALSVTNDGTEVLITLVDVHAGSVRLPRSLLAGLVGRYGPALADIDALPHDSGSPGSDPGDMRSVDELFDGKRIENRFVWPNGERPFRIRELAMDEGELRIGVDPL